MSGLIGQQFGRYQILEWIGQGGMATVYRARDTHLDRDVAVKIVRRESFSPEQFEINLKRFEREAKSVGGLSHPNIVGIIDYGLPTEAEWKKAARGAEDQLCRE